MLVPENPDDRSEVKLNAAHRNEAQHLYDCMLEQGITNGLQGREKNTVKHADAPVFYTLHIYVLNELEEQLEADNQKLIDRSVLLPDGRHAYVDDNDDTVFWIYPGDDPKNKQGGAAYKLEPNLQPLARHLAQCMETSGITDGRRAQAVCLERVAGVSPPSNAKPAAPQPSAAAPSAPPASSTDDDDPIGGGGFITPPDPR